jgi:hypothetical protein
VWLLVVVLRVPAALTSVGILSVDRYLLRRSSHGAVVAAHRDAASSRATAIVAMFAGLSRFLNRFMDAVQAVLCFPRDLQDVIGLGVLATQQRRPDPGVAGVVPGRFDNSRRAMLEPVLVIDPWAALRQTDRRGHESQPA